MCYTNEGAISKKEKEVEGAIEKEKKLQEMTERMKQLEDAITKKEKEFEDALGEEKKKVQKMAKRIQELEDAANSWMIGKIADYGITVSCLLPKAFESCRCCTRYALMYSRC